MDRDYAAGAEVPDDRTATQKASSVADKLNSLLGRANDINATLGRGNEIKSAGVREAKPPMPPRMLHDSLDEASATADRINAVLDGIERRL